MLTQPERRSFGDLEAPRLQAVGPNLTLACFTLMKLRPARYMLDQAEAQGELLPGGTICETTSGTFGLALAMLGNWRGYQVHLVSDPAIDDRLQGRLTRLGATVDIVDQPAPEGGFQQPRLDRLMQFRKNNPAAYWPRQYDNPDNPDSYIEVADYLTSRLDRIDVLVGPVGSGGSMCGTARRLRQRNPRLRVLGVDGQNSVLFGQQDGPRLLRGIGNSLIPANVDHQLFDDIHWIGGRLGFSATRQLERLHGAFMGGTTGAAFMVARWWAQHHEDQQVVVLGPDEGHRYIDTIYNDSYIDRLPVWGSTIPKDPTWVADPADVASCWTAYRWRRRTRREVLNAAARRPSHHYRGRDTHRSGSRREPSRRRCRRFSHRNRQHPAGG